MKLVRQKLSLVSERKVILHYADSIEIQHNVADVTETRPLGQQIYIGGGIPPGIPGMPPPIGAPGICG
jgi:hypothetical protein